MYQLEYLISDFSILDSELPAGIEELFSIY